MEDSPPPNDLDILFQDNLVRTDFGYLDTSYNSDDYLSSPPQLTALNSSQLFNDSPPDEDSCNPNVEEELELLFPPFSSTSDQDETPSNSSAIRNEEPSPIPFGVTTVNGLVIHSFSSQNAANILACDSYSSKEDHVDPSQIEEKNATFEVACSCLIGDVELLPPQPQKMKSEKNLTKSANDCRLPREGSDMFKSCTILAEPSSSFQQNLKRRKKWKNSYLKGRFRVNEATGELEPVFESSCKDRSCTKDRQSLLREKVKLERNLAKHEKCINGLSRQHTQILKVFNRKDEVIQRLKQQLKMSKEKNKKLVSRLKSCDVSVEVQSLLYEEELADDSCEETET